MSNGSTGVGKKSKTRYVVESKLDAIKHAGKTFPGTRAENEPGIFLFKLPLEATEKEIRAWPVSIHAQDGESPRVSPSGREHWWVCTRPGKACWPKSGERSNGKPLHE